MRRRLSVSPQDLRLFSASSWAWCSAAAATAPSRRVLLQELMDAGLAGIEVHHRSFDAATVSAVGAVAEDLGLLPSGGTDYHGDGETYAEAIAETWVPPQIATGVMAVLGAGIAP